MTIVGGVKRRLEKLEAAAKAQLRHMYLFNECDPGPELLGRDLRPGERLVTDDTIDGQVIIREAQRATIDPDDYGLIFNKDGRQVGRFLGPSDQPGRTFEIEEDRETCSPPAS